MTVKELIGKLQRFDPDAPVFVYDSEIDHNVELEHAPFWMYCAGEEYDKNGFARRLNLYLTKTYNKPVVVI